MTMIFPLYWREKTVPVLFVKGKSILGCKLRTFSHPLSLPNWFGGIHDFKDFGPSRDRPYSSSNEFIFSCFETSARFMAQTYLLMMFASVLGTFTVIFSHDIKTLSVCLLLGAGYYFYPKLSFWAYRKYVEDTPTNNGWGMLPLISEESLKSACRLVGDPTKLDNWLTDPGIQSFKLHHHI